MSTNNIGYYEDLTKLSLNYHQISSNTHLISSAGYTYSDKKELGYSDKNIAVILVYGVLSKRCGRNYQSEKTVPEKHDKTIACLTAHGIHDTSMIRIIIDRVSRTKVFLHGHGCPNHDNHP